MFITITLLLVCQQDPAPEAGAGFAEATRIYQQVASGPTAGAGTLQTRLETVQKRVEELQSEITRVAGSLLSLERQEMERSLAIQSSFAGDERDRRLTDLQQTIAPRRAVLEENRTILERDLVGARQDLGQLQLQLDVVRAADPQRTAAPKTAGKVDARVRSYFLAKARALGLPQRRPLERWILGDEDRIE